MFGAEHHAGSVSRQGSGGGTPGEVVSDFAAQELGVGALGPQIDVDTAGSCHAQQGADPAENGAFSGHPRDLDR